MLLLAPYQPLLARRHSAISGSLVPRSIATATTLLAFAAASLALAAATSAQQLDRDPRVRSWSPPSSWKQTATQFVPGFEILVPAQDVALEEWAEHAIEWEGEPGVCYAGVAWSRDISDLDVRLYANERLVAQDVRPDHYPVAEWCVDNRTSMRLVTRAHSGTGIARSGVFVHINQREAAEGERDELSNRLLQAVSQTAARWMPVGDQWRRQFVSAGRATISVDVLAEHCYALVAVGESTVYDIDARLLDPAGEERALDAASDATPALTWCPERPGAWSVELAVVRGNGAVAARVLATPAR